MNDKLAKLTVDALELAAEEIQKLREENSRLKNEMLAVAKSTGCYIQYRPGGGFEDVSGSLAISVNKLKNMVKNNNLPTIPEGGTAVC